MSESQAEIRQFGPYHIIGVSYVGKNENNEVPQLWERKFIPRAKEIDAPKQASAFGICRCVPGMKDGTFEYVAAVEAKAGAALPEGMIAVEIPKADYIVIPVAGLAEVRKAWGTVPEELNRQQGWAPYCGPQGCECATHPCFEYYPPDFETAGRLFLYIPVRQRAA